MNMVLAAILREEPFGATIRDLSASALGLIGLALLVSSRESR